MRHAAVATLQLLVMLDVVQDWSRGDSSNLAEAAVQIETAARALVPVLSEARQGDMLVHARKQIDRAHQMLDGLGRR
ncbi:MAG: hypothetical protein EOO29_24395, partial [Comamonadaceae bacterium]